MPDAGREGGGGGGGGAVVNKANNKGCSYQNLCQICCSEVTTMMYMATS